MILSARSASVVNLFKCSNFKHRSTSLTCTCRTRGAGRLAQLSSGACAMEYLALTLDMLLPGGRALPRRICPSILQACCAICTRSVRCPVLTAHVILCRGCSHGAESVHERDRELGQVSSAPRRSERCAKPGTDTARGASSKVKIVEKSGEGGAEQVASSVLLLCKVLRLTST